MGAALAALPQTKAVENTRKLRTGKRRMTRAIDILTLHQICRDSPPRDAVPIMRNEWRDVKKLKINGKSEAEELHVAPSGLLWVGEIQLEACASSYIISPRWGWGW